MKRLRNEPDVELLVGPDRESIPAFSQILAVASDFFDAALASDMKEGRSKRIQLLDQKPADVHLLLEYISPGSDVVLNESNVFTLLPLFSQFQFTVALKAADKFCSEYSKMRWDGMGIATPAKLLQMAVDCSLSATRTTAMKHMTKSILAQHLGEIQPLAVDFRYAEVFMELWKVIRQIVLSPKQLADGVMTDPPSAETCSVMWPALAYSAARYHVLHDLPRCIFMSMPGGQYRRVADEDGDEVDGYITRIDAPAASMIKSAITDMLPGHDTSFEARSATEIDDYESEGFCIRGCAREVFQ